MAFARNMVESKSKVDQRFVNLYLLRKAHQKNHNFGYDNDLIVDRNLKARKGKRQKRVSASNDVSDIVEQIDPTIIL